MSDANSRQVRVIQAARAEVRNVLREHGIDPDTTPYGFITTHGYQERVANGAFGAGVHYPRPWPSGFPVDWLLPVLTIAKRPLPHEGLAT